VSVFSTVRGFKDIDCYEKEYFDDGSDSKGTDSESKGSAGIRVVGTVLVISTLMSVVMFPRLLLDEAA